MRLVVSIANQTAELFDQNDNCLRTYCISTAARGAGCEEGSYCTPTGRFCIAEKIGADMPRGAIFKSREHTGEFWRGEKREDDLILSRILWLDGLEPHNKNTHDRYIYLHGTNHEDKLGTPVSLGCIRFSNDDIIDLFNLLQKDDEVFIVN